MVQACEVCFGNPDDPQTKGVAQMEFEFPFDQAESVDSGWRNEVHKPWPITMTHNYVNIVREVCPFLNLSLKAG